MYQLGHYGLALLVYAPVGAALVREGHVVAAYLGGAVMVGTATFPDCDHRLPFVSHRGPTHSFLFAGLFGAAFGAAGSALAPVLGPTVGVDLAAFGFAVGALSVLAHLLGDVLTPMGIRPFWPLSGRSYSFGVTTAKSPIANYALFALGVFATAATVVGLGLIG
ncbi:metal-dependent hydrolase [Halostella sp. JP-L12]|uniref:metal-dependent hydrolase n=1 Tax=Halostella TaxID=1843185 RepID=UPI000EF78B72|nr:MULTISPECIES: metal-dependent hydrolase [Halostella]NHN49749.1 metal-dependent hydrolase [Halostella sp. JP-L12]